MNFMPAYNCNEGRLLYQVGIPELSTISRGHLPDYDQFHPIGLVAVSDSDFCLVSLSGCYIFCARVSVSFDYGPYVELRGVRCFQNDDVLRVINCLPVDSSLGRLAMKYMLLKKKRKARISSQEDGTRNKVRS